MKKRSRQTHREDSSCGTRHKEHTRRDGTVLLAACEMRMTLEYPVMPGNRFSNRLVRHAKMLGDAGKREAKLMEVAGLWKT